MEENGSTPGSLQGAISEFSSEMAESLPDPSQWPDRIETPEQAESVVGLYRYCEDLTKEVNRKASNASGQKVIRTNSTLSHQKIIDVVSRGKTVELVSVDLDQISTTGSAGSNTRRLYVEAAIAKYGLEEALRRLPPIIVSRNSYPNAPTELFTEDGHTRAMVAHQHGLKFVRGYLVG